MALNKCSLLLIKIFWNKSVHCQIDHRIKFVIKNLWKIKIFICNQFDNCPNFSYSEEIWSQPNISWHLLEVAYIFNNCSTLEPCQFIVEFPLLRAENDFIIIIVIIR